jgi:hypothetical protein
MLDYIAGVQQSWSGHNGEAKTYSPVRTVPQSLSPKEVTLFSD